MNRNWLWTVGVALGLGLALMVSQTARADHRHPIELYPGQSTYISPGIFKQVQVRCNPTPPPAHPAPGYPGYPGTGCYTGDADRLYRQLVLRRDRMVRGECPYPHSEGFGICQGPARAEDVQPSLQRFRAELSNLQYQVEEFCRNRSCLQVEVSQMAREFDRFVSELGFQRMVYGGRLAAPILHPGSHRLNCSGG